MSRVALFALGGTIAMASTPDGAAVELGLDAADLVAAVPGAREDRHRGGGRIAAAFEAMSRPPAPDR
jgi:L-asparaginase/Glu-tRNA(Gln) amidotransferase subunit D